MNEKRYVLIDKGDYDSFALIGEYDSEEEAEAAADIWDGAPELYVFDHFTLRDNGPTLPYYRRVRVCDDDRKYQDKHYDECGQIAHYDDELRQAKELLKRFVELGTEEKVTTYRLQQWLIEAAGICEEARGAPGRW